MARKKTVVETPAAPAAPAGPVDQNQINMAILQALQGINTKLDNLGTPSAAREAVPDKGNRRTQSRGGQSRLANNRRSEERIMPPMGYQSMLWVDTTKIPDNKSYFWVRESVRGEPDEANITQHLIQKWEPVPAERHPELVLPTLPGRESDTSGCIRRGGLILMQKDAQMVKAAKEWQRRNNMNQLRAGVVDKGELNERDARDSQFFVEHDETMIEQVRGSESFG